ncbi:FAD-binding oxidoreductase [Sphingomicrobium sp. XHP0235]|uniref:FAD-binding oxidoreductase n=1 Tax=Sphingomicrobium aquimarinum TaxID=3133971 RepID=UPI0031FE7DF0
MSDAVRMIEELRAILPERAIVSDPEAIAPWLTDWRGRWTGKAAALLQPSSTEEVQAIVRACAAHRVPIVPQGGNSSMVGGATPDDSGQAVILSLRRMTRIRELDVGPRQIVVEAGMVLETLHDKLAEQDLRLPIDLGARGSATIGGLVSTNAGGTQVLRHGTMGERVVGLEAVMADGSLLDTLNPLKKDNRGPRLDRLMIGGEGLFGIVTAVRLALTDLPKASATAWVGVRDPAEALELLRFCDARTDAIEGFEMMPQDVVAAAEAEFGLRAPLDEPQAIHVLIEAKSSDGALRGAIEAILADALEEGLATDAVVARSQAQADAMWAIRHSLSDAEKRFYGMANSHDISVPVDALPAFLDDARAMIEGDFPGVSVSGYGHLGDGNIHLHVRAMDRASDGWRAGEGAAIEKRVHDLVTDHGGSISAEHGIGVMKRGELERLDPIRTEMLRRIKRALDPDGILNPGKLV